MKVAPACDGFGKPYTCERIEVPGPGPAGPEEITPARVGPKRYWAQATAPELAGIGVERTSIWTRGSDGTWSNVSTQSSDPSLSRSRSIGGEPCPVLPSSPKPGIRLPSARNAGRLPSGRIGITSRTPSWSTSPMSGGQKAVESAGARGSCAATGYPLREDPL